MPTAFLPPEADAAREQSSYREHLGAELDAFLSEQQAVLQDVSMESLPLLDAVSALAQGGKRLRALLNYWGWRGAGGAELGLPAVRSGVALELFQSAALIHDDIIDRSDTRRGGPSVHRRFSTAHSDASWHLDGTHFGSSAAILAGDLCLSLSEEMFAAVGAQAAHGTPARRIFNRMRTEVMAGQYLDILEEVVGPTHEPERAVVRARNILRYKSAKYTTEHPLTLGGALAGAPTELMDWYSRFALPLGEAFQLRTTSSASSAIRHKRANPQAMTCAKESALSWSPTPCHSADLRRRKPLPPVWAGRTWTTTALHGCARSWRNPGRWRPPRPSSKATHRLPSTRSNRCPLMTSPGRRCAPWPTPL